ncbi:MAG: DUF1330 domain-containing protein [Alphaproteobacteria bacterium]|nr:DUF1330 domain-containing protein [Alphaproteobacteria bacterium]
MPALQPTTEQISRFTKDDHDGPIVMVNLLKFRERAQYAPDDPEHGDDISGAEAYARYGRGVAELTSDPQIGVTTIYAGPAAGFLIGEGDWDMVILARYPSRAHMARMMRDPRYQAAHRHRAAGLLHQDLIETRPHLIETRPQES